MLTAGAADKPPRPQPPVSSTHPTHTNTHTPLLMLPPACVRSEKLDKQLAEQQAVVTARRGEALKAQQEAQAAQAAQKVQAGHTVQ